MTARSRSFALERTRIAVLPPGVPHSYDIFPGVGAEEAVHLAECLLSEWIDPERIAVHAARLSPECLVLDEADAIPERILPEWETVLGTVEHVFHIMDVLSRRSTAGQARADTWLRSVVVFTEAGFAEPVSLATVAGKPHVPLELLATVPRRDRYHARGVAPRADRRRSREQPVTRTSVTPSRSPTAHWRSGRARGSSIPDIPGGSADR
jgi:hypothetical protein